MTENYTIYCCVPNCDSNSKKYPTKIFIKLPKSVELEKQWTEAIGIIGNYSIFQENSNLFLCEDHLNLPKDIVNWSNIQNKAIQIKLEKDAVPCNGESSLELSVQLKTEPAENLNFNPVCEEETSSERDDIRDTERTTFIKRCFIPECKSNSRETPEKHFLRLPKGIEVRKQLAELFGKHEKNTVFHERSTIFCCTDHLDLSKDDIKKWIMFDDETGIPIRIKRQGLPHIFSIQFQCSTNPKSIFINDLKVEETSRSEDTSNSKIIEIDIKKDPLESLESQIIDEVFVKSDFHLLQLDENDLSLNCNEEFDTNANSEVENDQLVDLIQNIEEEVITESSDDKTGGEKDNSVVLRNDIPQNQETRTFLIMKLIEPKSQEKLPILPERPHRPQKSKIVTYSDQGIQCNIKPTKRQYKSKCTYIERKYLFENNNLSLYEERSSLLLNSLNKWQDNSIHMKNSKKDDSLNAGNNLALIHKLIQSYPLKYIGLPVQHFSDFISNIHENTGLPYNNILLVFLKIRENQSFERLGDSFGMSQEEASMHFVESVPPIANYLKRNFIWPKINSDLTESLFKRVFKNIKLIIDCLEVEVEKPDEPHDAGLVKSVNKNCYTLKYLISYTPEGLVNYISEGYGGSRKDDFLLKNSKFLLQIPFSSTDVILTDRNFNPIENLCSEKNCEFLKFCEKVQMLQNFSHIKKLQDYVVCVMKRLREFRLISSHTNLNQEITSVLDFIVIIVCAIVNVQGSVPFEA